MHGLIVKRRRTVGPLAPQLARSLAAHASMGRAVIVAESPMASLASVKKQWFRLERKLWTERARTLKASKILEYTEQLAAMRRIRFSAKLPEDTLEADVTFATSADLIHRAPECRMMYVTYEISTEDLHMITSWMPKNAEVVLYEQT